MLPTEIEGQKACNPSSLFHELDSFSLQLLDTLLKWPHRCRPPKLCQLITLIELINSMNEEVEVFPLLDVAGLQPIDLFVRFPDREFLIFSVRSNGDATVTYREKSKSLYLKHGKKGASKWKPDPLTMLSDQAYFLRKHRRDLFVSSRGVRKPMPKVLVIGGKTQLQHHKEHLYKEVGEQAFLFLPRDNGACYVIHQEQVVDFIRAHLNERRHGSERPSRRNISNIPTSPQTTLYFDGGDRIDLGIGSGGYAIVQGQESILGGVFLQESTVMVAEYTGLIAGLRKCLEIQVAPTVIKGDNRTVIQQLSGIAKVRNSDLRSPYEEAIALLDKFYPRPQLVWIPREANSLADQACNHIMDQHMGSVWLDAAPSQTKRRWLSGRRKEWIDVH